MVRTSVAAAVLYASAPAAPPADAGPQSAPAPVAVQWTAPAQCPTAERFRDWLDRALAEGSGPREAVAVAAAITQRDRQFVLELRVHRGDLAGEPIGQRRLEGSDCTTLSRAGVLIAALAIDPTAQLPDEPEPTEPPPAEVPTVEPEPEPEPEPTEPEPDTPPTEPPPDNLTAIEPEPIDDPPEDRQPNVNVGLRAGAGAGLSVLPRAVVVFGAGVAVWGRRWRAELGASYWSPTTTRPSPEGRARVQQWTLDPRGCVRLRPGPLDLPICGGVEIGAVHGQGLDVPQPRRVRSLRFALTAGASIIWRPAAADERFGVWAGGDLLVAVARARFRPFPAATTRIYHTPLFGGRVGLGIELRLR